MAVAGSHAGTPETNPALREAATLTAAPLYSLSSRAAHATPYVPAPRIGRAAPTPSHVLSTAAAYREPELPRRERRRRYSHVPDTRWIYVLVNGNDHSQPVHFVVNRKYHRTFEVLLNDLTQRLHPSFGAVRNVYTPVNGHRVEGFDGLLPNHRYVVGGYEKFKKVDKGYPKTPDRTKKLPKRLPIKVPPTKPKYVTVAPRIYRLNPDILSFYVCKNGDDVATPSRFIVPKQQARRLEDILEIVGQKIQPQAGFVRRLYSTSGRPLRRLEDLEQDHCYVAVGSCETFKLANYHKSSDKQWYLPPRFNLKKRRRHVGYLRNTPSYSDLSDYNTNLYNISPHHYGRRYFVSDVEPRSRDDVHRSQDSGIAGGRSFRPTGRHLSELQQNEGSTSGRFNSTRPSGRGNNDRMLAADKTPHENGSRIRVPTRTYPHMRRRLPAERTNTAITAKRNTQQDHLTGRRYYDTEIVQNFPSARKTSANQKAHVNYDMSGNGVFYAKELNPITRGAQEIRDTVETIEDVPVDMTYAKEIQEEDVPEEDENSNISDVDNDADDTASTTSEHHVTSEEERMAVRLKRLSLGSRSSTAPFRPPILKVRFYNEIH